MKIYQFTSFLNLEIKMFKMFNRDLFENIDDNYVKKIYNEYEIECNRVIRGLMRLRNDNLLNQFLENLQKEDDSKLKRILNMNFADVHFGDGTTLVTELGYWGEDDYIELLANYGANIGPWFKDFVANGYDIEEYESFIDKWQNYLDWEDSNVRHYVRISSVPIFKFLVSIKYKFNSDDIYSLDLIDDIYFKSKVVKYIYKNNKDLFNILDENNDNLNIIFSILMKKKCSNIGENNWRITKFLPYLFNLGFDTDYIDNDGNNIFMFACKCKDIDVVNILYNRYLRNGDLHNQIYKKNNNGETIIHLAIRYKFNYMLEIIVNNKQVRQKRYNINFDSEDSDEEIEDDNLDESSDNKSNDFLSYVSLLDTDEEGNNIFMYACKYKNIDVVNILYNRYLRNDELHNQIFKKNNYGETIIHLAIRYNFNYMLEIILNNMYVGQKRRKIDFGSEDSNKEIEDNNLDESSDNKIIKFLFDGNELITRSNETLLHYASMYNNCDSIKLLLDNGLFESKDKKSKNE